MAKSHKFTHTHIEHHSDGSHTVHHVHQDGPAHDKKYAAADHDHMMDGMMDNTSAPNPGEAPPAAPAPGGPAAALAAPGGVPVPPPGA